VIQRVRSEAFAFGYEKRIHICPDKCSDKHIKMKLKNITTKLPILKYKVFTIKTPELGQLFTLSFGLFS
jgi:hypothetical protein